MRKFDTGADDSGDIGRLAEQLYTQPSGDDLLRLPVALGHQSTVPAVLRTLTDRIGPPTYYGGRADGPSIRWRSESRTLLLDQGRDGLQLTVRRTADLEGREFEIFERGVGDEPGQTPRYAALPYLWQLHTSDQGTPPPAVAATHTASSWERLEESLQTLLAAWSAQIPDQLGADGDWAPGFDIVNRADAKRVLAVHYSARDDLSAFVHDQDGPEVAGQREAITGRGWQEWLPVLRCWESYFAPGAEGAAAIARLVVAELRFRGADSPRDLSVTRIDAFVPGQLILPGLGIGR
ncbi:hypothetical protein [Streptomyces sp. NPDC000133]|uniref:hypothetical protein n=1 Tax=Streptomyces sp. NPDC000133 TaxID=3364535 RepID=UPI00369ECBA6